LLLVLAFAFFAPSATAAGTSAFDDALDTSFGAPDLVKTTSTVGDDDVLAVETIFVPRPPAGWGGCSPLFTICLPPDMNITWFLDTDGNPGTGSLSEQGADARVVAVPSRGGAVTMESTRWNASRGRFEAGAVPAFTGGGDRVRWSLRLGDLGIGRPASLGLRVVSIYRSFSVSGLMFEYLDRAPDTGFSTLPVPGPPPPSKACTDAAAKANKLQGQIRSASRKLRSRSARVRRRARARVRALKRSRAKALDAIRRNCPKPVRTGTQTAPPAGCRIVTKLVFVLEGVGSNARYVLQPKPVVECG
jgi:hypothetical protein